MIFQGRSGGNCSVTCKIKFNLKSLILSGFLLFISSSTNALESPLHLGAVFAREIDKRLNPPLEEIRYIADHASIALNREGLGQLPPQYLAVVDRNPKIQVIFIYWMDSEATLQLIGASPVSTGRPGGFDYFETPVGVFQHSIKNMDFRAEGSKNSNGIRGYGIRGMRVFDFGWQQAKRGWGNRKLSTMRLQMHATDPDLLEHRLGSVLSKGCIRIPASLNLFIDRYGILDADYALAIHKGKTLWVLNTARDMTPWPGQYLVVIDTIRKKRPKWASIIFRTR